MDPSDFYHSHARCVALFAPQVFIDDILFSAYEMDLVLSVTGYTVTKIRVKIWYFEDTNLLYDIVFFLRSMNRIISIPNFHVILMRITDISIPIFLTTKIIKWKYHFDAKFSKKSSTCSILIDFCVSGACMTEWHSFTLIQTPFQLSRCPSSHNTSRWNQKTIY